MLLDFVLEIGVVDCDDVRHERFSSVVTRTVTGASKSPFAPVIWMQESSRRGTQIAHIGIAVRSLPTIVAHSIATLGLADIPLDDSDGEDHRVGGGRRSSSSEAESAGL